MGCAKRGPEHSRGKSSSLFACVAFTCGKSEKFLYAAARLQGALYVTQHGQHYSSDGTSNVRVGARKRQCGTPRATQARYTEEPLVHPAVDVGDAMAATTSIDVASSPWRSPKKKAAPQRRESQVAGDRCSSPRSDRQLSCARARQAGCARSKHVAPVRSPRRPSWARTTAAQQQQPSQRCQRRRDRRDYSLVHAAASSHCTSDMPGRVGRPQITSLAWASLVDAAARVGRAHPCVGCGS